jgi:hypothetical protein
LGVGYKGLFFVEKWLNNEKNEQGTHSTKMVADNPAENTPNASKRISPKCPPKPISSKFLKKSYLWAKFIYSEKAQKICKIFPLLLTTVHTVKSKEKISQIFVAF